MHAAGGKVAVQLWHAGRQLFAPDFDEFPDDWPKEIVSSSAIPCSEVVPYKPRELTTDEVYEIIEAFGQAGRRAKEAGFDCIEIHGAHGYLIDQFLNEYTNKRTDEFGGSFENRCRFGKLVIDSVRKNVGPDFPVIMRLNAFEGALQPGGIEIEDAVRAAKRFSAHGLDALAVVCALGSRPNNEVVDLVKGTGYSVWGHRGREAPLQDHQRRARGERARPEHLGGAL